MSLEKYNQQLLVIYNLKDLKGKVTPMADGVELDVNEKERV